VWYDDVINKHTYWSEEMKVMKVTPDLLKKHLPHFCDDGSMQTPDVAKIVRECGVDLPDVPKWIVFQYANTVVRSFRDNFSYDLQYKEN